MGFKQVSIKSGRNQLPVFEALLLFALPLLFTFRNCDVEFAERIQQLTGTGGPRDGY